MPRDSRSIPLLIGRFDEVNCSIARYGQSRSTGATAPPGWCVSHSLAHQSQAIDAVFKLVAQRGKHRGGRSVSPLDNREAMA